MLVTGTPTEVLFTLMTYGIPVDLLPVSNDGKLKKTNSKWWFQALAKKEEALKEGKAFDKVAIPGNIDVLFGKGETIQNHYGNQALRQMLSQTLESYNQMKKSEKAAHNRKVVEMVKKQGGRFLIRSADGWWEEVSDDKARSKISKTYCDVKTKFLSTKSAVSSASKGTNIGQVSHCKRQRVNMEPLSILSTAVPGQEKCCWVSQA